MPTSTFDERELISTALDLEHAARVFPEKTGFDLQRAVLELQHGGPLPGRQLSIGPGMWEKLRGDIARFGAVLEQIVSKRHALPAAVLSDWLPLLPNVSLVPCEIRDGELRYRLRADDLRATLAFVLFLLLDERFLVSLGKCQLETCGKFFLATVSSSGGRPRTRYCKEAHMLEAHNQDAARRVAKHRRKAKRGK